MISYVYDDVPELPASRNVEVPERDHEFYDLMYGIQELEYALPDYIRAERQALGVTDELARDTVLREILEQTSLEYRFPLAQVVIDTLMDRVVPKGFQVDESMQQKFDELWEAIDMDIWEPKIRSTMLLYGDAYTLTWLDDGETPEDDDTIEAGIVNNIFTPKDTRAIYDDNNLRRVKYVIRWYERDKMQFAELHYRDRIEYFMTTKSSATGVRVEDWMRYAPDDTEGGEVVENPYGEICIKHHRTDLPYGKPVHFNGYGAQNAIAKLLVTEICTIEEQGWPSRYGLVGQGRELESTNDTPDYPFDDMGSAGPDYPRSRRATHRSQFRNRPGHIQMYTGLDSVGQLDAADPAAFTDPVETFFSLLSMLTRTPLYAFKPGGEQPSGRARQIADAPLESHKKAIQALATPSYRDMIRLQMRMAYNLVITDFNIVWEPTVMATDKEDWEVVRMKIEAGVSFDKAMEEAGYDPKVIESWIDERQKFSTQEVIDLVKQISEACSKLSTPLSPEQIFDILKELLAEIEIDIGNYEEPEIPPLLDPTNPDNMLPPGDPEAEPESEGKTNDLQKPVRESDSRRTDRGSAGGSTGTAAK